MPERGGKSSDRGWRYAIFFFSPTSRFGPPPPPPSLRPSPLPLFTPCTLPQFFPVQSNGEHFGDEAFDRSPENTAAYVVLMQIHAALIWCYSSLRAPRVRRRFRADISLSGRPVRCGEEVRILWILRCLFCAMQNSIRHEIVGKQVEPESYFDLPRKRKIVPRYTIRQVCSFGRPCSCAPTFFP